MSRLEDDIARAQADTSPWGPAEASRVWKRIDGGRADLATPVPWGALAVAATVVIALTATWVLVRPDRPAAVPAIAEASHTAPPSTPAPTIGIEPDQPPPPAEANPAPQDPASVLLQRDAVIEQSDGHARYVSGEAWSGEVVVAADVRVSGPAGEFVVERNEDAVVVTSVSNVVYVVTGDRRLRVEPGTTVTVELGAAIRDTPTRPAKNHDPEQSASALLSRADAARVSGDLQDAAKALRAFVRRFPRHKDAGAAFFQLGKVERKRGRHSAAARAFGKSRSANHTEALKSDALAEQARSLARAGKHKDARARAQEYLKWKPAGIHAADMRALLTTQP